MLVSPPKEALKLTIKRLITRLTKHHQLLHSILLLLASNTRKQITSLVFSVQKREKMSWAGDWMCGACQHMNFKKRESCQKCNFPKYGTQADIPTYMYNTNANVNRTEVLAGDWYCQSINCGAHNYASRPSCFRCGNLKCDYGTVGVGYATPGGEMMMASAEYSSQQQLLPGWKAGDWLCSRPGCGLHNYACRMECYKCRTPRDYGGAM